MSREMFSWLLRFGRSKEYRAFIFTFETQPKYTASSHLLNIIILPRAKYATNAYCASEVSRK